MKTTVDVIKNEDQTMLTLGDSRISLSHSPGRDIHDFFVRNVLEKPDPPVKQVGHVVAVASKRTIAYVTGACALVVVVVSAAMAGIYAVTHGPETLNNLASSTLSGIGIAIGGCLGSALILRFKSARHYIRSILKDLQ